MQTQLTLDETLLKQAMQITGLTNPQAVIEFALHELVTHSPPVETSSEIITDDMIEAVCGILKTSRTVSLEEM